MNILGKRSDLPFSCKSDRYKEKSTASFTHEQNIVCSQLFAGHVVDSRPMKRKKSLLQMIIKFISINPLLKGGGGGFGAFLFQAHSKGP